MYANIFILRKPGSKETGSFIGDSRGRRDEVAVCLLLFWLPIGELSVATYTE